jgi:hypothetical protein
MAHHGARLSGLLGLVGLAASVGCGGVTPAATTTGAGGAGGGTHGDMDGGAGTHADAPAERPPTTVADGCSDVAKALCDALNGCAPLFVEYLYGDEATCISRAALSCTTDQMVPGITRTADDLVSCAAAAATTSCADALAGNFPSICSVKPGPVINGMACGSNWQCQSTYCNKTDACGVCSPREAAGGDCTVDEGCVAGLVCGNKKCVAPAGPNAACNLPGQPCRSDLYCTSPTGSGTCATRIAAGGPCADNPSDACDFVHGDICNTTNHTCVMIKVGKGGDMCSLASKTVCVGGVGPCSDFLLGGVCANPAQDGTACGGNAVCVPPATCVDKICRLPSAPDCH